MVLLLILVFRPSGLFSRRVSRPEDGMMRLRRYYPVLAVGRARGRAAGGARSADATYYMTQLTMSAYYALVVIGLCLLMGYAGQASLGTRASSPSAATRSRS